MKMEKQSIFRTTLSWALTYVGGAISYPMLWWDLSFLCPIYNKIMGWSIDLDKAGKIWLYVEEE